MSAITLNELWMLMVALVTIQTGIAVAIVARVPLLAVYSIPPAVVGDVVAAKLLARARRAAARHEPALALAWATP